VFNSVLNKKQKKVLQLFLRTPCKQYGLP